MTNLIDQEEFNKAVASAFSGGGILVYNHSIRKLRSILLNRYGVSNKDLVKEFKGWFYEKELDRKWRPVLCSLKTFVLSCIRIFLLKLLKEKDDYYKNTYSIENIKYPFVSNSNSACFKHEGKWTQIPSIYLDSQEDDYMLCELEHCINGFNIVKGYNSVYLSLFAGEIKINEAAALLGVSKITVIRTLTKYRIELYEYLDKLGYRYEDLLEIYKK